MFEDEAKKTKSSSNDPFDKIANAEVSKRGVYPVPGAYPMLYVDVLKLITSRNDDLLFIAEFDIIDSNVTERPSGTRMSWSANLKHDPAPGNIKAFIAAVMDRPPEEVTSQAASMACSDKNPCHGRLVRLEASITTTKAGNAFTVCDFHPIADDAQKLAKELREKAGFAAF
jgi:hypothetical protein